MATGLTTGRTSPLPTARHDDGDDGHGAHADERRQADEHEQGCGYEEDSFEVPDDEEEEEEEEEEPEHEHGEAAAASVAVSGAEEGGDSLAATAEEEIEEVEDAEMVRGTGVEDADDPSATLARRRLPFAAANNRANSAGLRVQSARGPRSSAYAAHENGSYIAVTSAGAGAGAGPATGKATTRRRPLSATRRADKAGAARESSSSSAARAGATEREDIGAIILAMQHENRHSSARASSSSSSTPSAARTHGASAAAGREGPGPERGPAAPAASHAGSAADTGGRWGDRDVIVQRFSHLHEDKQRFLMDVLDTLEQTELPADDAGAARAAHEMGAAAAEPEARSGVDDKLKLLKLKRSLQRSASRRRSASGSDDGPAAGADATSAPWDRRRVVLRLHSSQSSSRGLVALAGIQLLDASLRALPCVPASAASAASAAGPTVVLADLRVCGGSNSAMVQQLHRAAAPGAAEAVDEACAYALLPDFSGRRAPRAAGGDGGGEEEGARPGRRPWFGHLANVDDHPLEVRLTLAVPPASGASASDAGARAPRFLRLLDAAAITDARDAGVFRRFGACMVELEWDGAVCYRGEATCAERGDEKDGEEEEDAGTLIPLPPPDPTARPDAAGIESADAGGDAALAADAAVAGVHAAPLMAAGAADGGQDDDGGDGACADRGLMSASFTSDIMVRPDAEDAGHAEVADDPGAADERDDGTPIWLRGMLQSTSDAVENEEQVSRMRMSIDGTAGAEAHGGAPSPSAAAGGSRARGRRPARSIVNESLDSLSGFFRRQTGRIGARTRPEDGEGEDAGAPARADGGGGGAHAGMDDDTLDAYIAGVAQPAAAPSSGGGGAAGPAPPLTIVSESFAASVNAFGAIPTLPLVRRTLRLHLLTTWGDEHYVGLTAVEIFDEHGVHVSIADPIGAVSASPHGVTDGDGNDPRTPDKVIDGVCATCDDTHAWLAPFVGHNASVTEEAGAGADGGGAEAPNPAVACRLAPCGRPCNTLAISLPAPRRIGMLRIWNYNKDRIHSARGVRHLAIVADGGDDGAGAGAGGPPPPGRVLFFGEIRRASGHHATCCNTCEPILFTDCADAMRAVDAHDEKYVHALRAYEMSLRGDDDDEEDDRLDRRGDDEEASGGPGRAHLGDAIAT